MLNIEYCKHINLRSIMLQKFLRLLKKSLVILVFIVPVQASLFQSFQQKLSFTHLQNLLLLHTTDITKNMYLIQAKKLFKKSGYSADFERLQQQAINEYAKVKIPQYRQLAIVDYGNISNKNELRKIPYIGCAQASPHVLTYDEDGIVYIHKQKFLTDNNIPVGWIDYLYCKNTDGSYNRGYINFVGVTEECRGKHYGAYLMTYALHEMQIVGVPMTGLQAANEIAACFHKKIGFELIHPGSLVMQREIPHFNWPFTIFA